VDWRTLDLVVLLVAAIGCPLVVKRAGGGPKELVLSLGGYWLATEIAKRVVPAGFGRPLIGLTVIAIIGWYFLSPKASVGDDV
jgi:hypothetical protein